MNSQTSSDWTITTIRELEDLGAIELGRGQIISERDIEANPGHYPVYSSSARGNGEFGRYGKFMFDEELVTWSVDGGGKFFYRPQSRFSITNVSGFLRVRAKDEIDTYYAWAHLFSIWETMTFNYTEKLHPSILRERFSFSYPELAEQKKIARVLKVVQRAIEQQERLIVLTTELKKSLMHKLFSEGLRGEPQKQTEIGQIPNEWEVVTIGEVCDLGTGTTPSTKNADYYSGEVPFVRTAEILNNRISDTKTKISKQAVKDCHLKVYPSGTVLMAMYGQGKTRGQVGLLEIGACTTQNSAAIQPRGETDSEFLWQYLRSRYDKLRGAGAVGHISHLNLGYLANFKVIKPPLIEQREIASILRTVDERISRFEAKQWLLQDLFRTLLHQLMTAQIRVHDVDLSFLEQEAVTS
jgi:type I restriction enzyme, S subunit